MGVVLRGAVALAAGLLLGGLAAPLSAQDSAAVPLDEARVAALVEACGGRDTEVLLVERLARHGLEAPPEGAGRSLESAVDRALEPANNPERAAAALRELRSSLTGGPEADQALGYLVLRNFAFYEALNCQGLKQWYGHLVVYRDLGETAAEGDPNRDYYAGAVAKFKGKLALTLRARDRLAEKERVALSAIGF